MGGVYSGGGAFPAHPHGRFENCRLRLLQAYSVFKSLYLFTRRSFSGMSDTIAIVLLSSTSYQKLFFFFGRHFLTFFRCGSGLWRKSPDVSSKFLPLPHESGSSHGWCKMNQSMDSPASTTAPSILSPSIFEVNEAPIRCAHHVGGHSGIDIAMKEKNPLSFHQFHAPATDLDDKNNSLRRQHPVVVTNALNGYSGSTRSYLMHSRISEKQE